MNVKLRYIWKINYPKKKTIPFHFHNFHEIIYYFKANGVSQYINKSRLSDSLSLLNANIQYIKTPKENSKLTEIAFADSHLIYYPPGIVHNETHFNPNAQLICIGFEFENVHGIIPPDSFFDKYDLFKKKINRIVTLYREKSDFYILSIENQLADILVELLKTTSSKTSVNSKLDYTIAYLNDSFLNPISISQLAETVGYSVEHFRKLFKEYTGTSPKRYIIDKKIEHAKLLLSNSTLPCSDISVLCGFSNYAQFSSFFKKEVNLSPKDYRETSKSISVRITE